MTIQEKRYTREDLMRLAEAGKRYELIHGELREMAPVGNPHGMLVVRLSYYLTGFTLETKSGIINTEVGFDLAEDTTVAPDIAFFVTSRFEKGQLHNFIPGAPDLAVEVVSPSESANDIHDKVNLYLEAGTELVWILYAKSRTIAVHNKAGSITLKQGDFLEGGNVLPGFKVSVEDIFSVLDDLEE